MSVAYRHEYGSGEDAYETANPASPLEKIGRHAIMGSDELGAAIGRANEARREWACMPGLERPHRLNAFIDAVESRADEMAPAGALDQGKLFRESKGDVLNSCARADRFPNGNNLIQRFLAESQNGMIHVNHGTVPDNNMPFGGIKNSGVVAYSVGPTAVNFYTSEHSACVVW